MADQVLARLVAVGAPVQRGREPLGVCRLAYEFARTAVALVGNSPLRSSATKQVHRPRPQSPPCAVESIPARSTKKAGLGVLEARQHLQPQGRPTPQATDRAGRGCRGCRRRQRWAIEGRLAVPRTARDIPPRPGTSAQARHVLFDDPGLDRPHVPGVVGSHHPATARMYSPPSLAYRTGSGSQRVLLRLDDHPAAIVVALQDVERLRVVDPAVTGDREAPSITAHANDIEPARATSAMWSRTSLTCRCTVRSM